MVAPKLNLLVKEDGSTVALCDKAELDGVSATAPPKQGRSKQFYTSMVIIVCLVILSVVGCVILMQRRTPSFRPICGSGWDMDQEHTIKNLDNGEIYDEEIYMNVEENMMLNKGDDGTITVHDVISGYSATIISTTREDSACLIYKNDLAPKRSMLQLNEAYKYLESEDPLETRMDRSDIVAMLSPIKSNSWVPMKLVRSCEGRAMYRAKKSKNMKRAKRQNSDNAVSASENANRAMTEDASQLLPPNLYVGEGESDHNKDCCYHCARPRFFCRRICFPQEMPDYPYFYNRCDTRTCWAIFPCSFWVQRALGRN